jgi:hypothetical protein
MFNIFFAAASKTLLTFGKNELNGDLGFLAIANSRIKAMKDDKVIFTAKNRKENRTDQVTLSGVEFIRRFLLHSLPRGFVRIRHYGFLANRNRSENLNAIRH